MLRKLMVLVFALLFAIAMIGCEGEEGPQGPAGPQGEKGDPGDDGKDFTTEPYTYLGNNGEQCEHCHGDVVEAWSGTAHPNAYADLEDADKENPYCVQCHVTGVDVHVEFGASEFPEGDDMYGFDDYFGVEGDTAAMRRDALAGVQCEACHGPLGPIEDNIFAHQAEVGVGTYVTEDGEFVSTCNPCHERQLEEWSESGHAMAAGGDLTAFQEEHYASGSCATCHTSEGYLAANDPAYANAEFEEYTFVGCVACHDPHDAENPGQLRTVGAVYVEYHLGYDPEEDGEAGTFEGYGAGQTCAQCHHARRDTDNVLGQIAEGYGHFGPHSSPQMDMFVGWGSYELEGYEYDREFVHQNAIEDACVSCHMVRFEELHGDEALHTYHQFQPQGAACNPCHTLEPGDFDYQNVQTETQALMDELAGLFGYPDVEAFMNEDTGWDNQADGVTADERAAAYALYFVYNDGSLGVHNRAYATDLLQNAIDFLSE